MAKSGLLRYNEGVDSRSPMGLPRLLCAAF